jgi:hypothetical protein
VCSSANRKRPTISPAREQRDTHEVCSKRSIARTPALAPPIPKTSRQNSSSVSTVILGDQYIASNMFYFCATMFGEVSTEVFQRSNAHASASTPGQTACIAPQRRNASHHRGKNADHAAGKSLKNSRERSRPLTRSLSKGNGKPTKADCTVRRWMKRPA